MNPQIPNLPPLTLTLTDTQWPFTYLDHDRQIARAIVYDDAGYFYFVRADRDDDFGKATLIETAGGGVEPGEDLETAIHRELSEELGVRTQVLGEIAQVHDAYHLIHRRNHNHYFLCRALSWGPTHQTPEEQQDFHLSTLRLTYPEALAEYQRRACTPLGRLVCSRELPVLRRAGALLRLSPD